MKRVRLSDSVEGVLSTAEAGGGADLHPHGPPGSPTAQPSQKRVLRSSPDTLSCGVRLHARVSRREEALTLILLDCSVCVCMCV